MSISHRLANINDTFIIQYSDDENKRVFRGFKSISDFSNWYTVNYKYLTFPCEVIKDTKQKLRFDIDCKHNVIDIKDLIFHLLLYIPNAKYLLYDISKGNIMSYHLVITNIYFPNSESIRMFAYNIINNIKKEYREVIDKHVYNRVQFFRLEGSSKENQHRYKWLINNRGKLSNRFLDGLITNTHNCVLYAVKYKYISTTSTTTITAIDKIYIMKFQSNVCTIGHNGDFSIRNIVDNIIILNRNVPTYCDTCMRLHDNENPFVIRLSGLTYFCCRRSNKLQKVVITI